MDDGSCVGAAVCERVDMSHDVVPEFALLLRCHGKVDVVCVALHLQNLGVCDGQTQSLKDREAEGDEEERHRQKEKQEGGRQRCLQHFSL